MSDNSEDAVDVLSVEPPGADWTLILAHGAGQGMDSPFMAHIADARAAAGLVCLGYPFHPPGKPDRPRTEHLRVLRTPMLICQRPAIPVVPV